MKDEGGTTPLARFFFASMCRPGTAPGCGPYDIIRTAYRRRKPVPVCCACCGVYAARRARIRSVSSLTLWREPQTLHILRCQRFQPGGGCKHLPPFFSVARAVPV